MIYRNRGANDIRFYLGGDGGDVQVLDEVRRSEDGSAGRFRMLEHLMLRSGGRRDASSSGSGDEAQSMSRIRSLDRIRRLDQIADAYNSPPPSSSAAVVNIDEDSDDDISTSPPLRRSRWSYMDYPLGLTNAYDYLRSRFPVRGGEDVDNAFMDSFGSRFTRRNITSNAPARVYTATRPESPITIDDSVPTPSNANRSITIDDDSDIEIVNNSGPSLSQGPSRRT